MDTAKITNVELVQTRVNDLDVKFIIGGIGRFVVLLAYGNVKQSVLNPPA